MDISKAATAMGRKGGQAGTGAAKRREHTTPEHMRAIRAQRPKPQVYESRGEWGGYTVREGLKGWIVESWSRVTGDRTDRKVVLAYAPDVPRTLRLDAPINACGTLGAHLVLGTVRVAEGAPDDERYRTGLRVLRVGRIVR